MNYSEPCQYSTRLIEKLKSLDTKNVLDFDLINKAIFWAKKYHGDQKRKSGEAYYTHPLEVAYMVSDYKFKTDVIVASILHDIVEDTKVTAGMIVDNFGWRIAEMVDRLTRDRPDGSKLTIEQILNNIYQLKDIEALVVKLFDRLHNVKTLGYQSETKREHTISETITQFIVPAIYYGYNDMEKVLWKIYCHHKSIDYNLLAFIDGQFNTKTPSVLSQVHKNAEFLK